MKLLLTVVLSLLLAACASSNGGGLIVGQSSADEVIRVMGEPHDQWTDPDGTRRLVYPDGPMGAHTYMVIIGKDGKVRSVENALSSQTLAEIKTGMSKDEVLRVLGPPEPTWSVYFKARDELVWEWRICDEWNQSARFDVLFDGAKGIVRSTMTLRENCGANVCWCSR